MACRRFDQVLNSSNRHSHATHSLNLPEASHPGLEAKVFTSQVVPCLLCLVYTKTNEACRLKFATQHPEAVDSRGGCDRCQ